MRLSQDLIDQAAQDLIGAETSGRQIGLLSLRHPGMDMDDAYAVQSAILRAKLAQGRRVSKDKMILQPEDLKGLRIRGLDKFMMRASRRSGQRP